MTNFESTEGAKHNLGNDPEFIDLDELAVDGGVVPGEEEKEVQEGSMIGDHSEDGLEPDAEWETKLKTDLDKDVKNLQPNEIQTSGDNFADDIQQYHDEELIEAQKRALMKQNFIFRNDEIDHGNKDHKRDTIRGQENAA